MFEAPPAARRSLDLEPATWREAATAATSMLLGVDTPWETVRDASATPPGDPFVEHLGAAIELTPIDDRCSSWQVILHSPQPVVQSLTAAVTGGPADEVLVQDVMNELLNVIAGSVKSSLSGDWGLGLPHPLETSADEAAAGELLVTFSMPDDAGQLSLSVLRPAAASESVRL